MDQVIIFIIKKQKYPWGRCWTRSSSPAARCYAPQPETGKYTIAGIPRRFPVIPWGIDVARRVCAGVQIMLSVSAHLSKKQDISAARWGTTISTPRTGELGKVLRWRRVCVPDCCLPIWKYDLYDQYSPKRSLRLYHINSTLWKGRGGKKRKKKLTWALCVQTYLAEDAHRRVCLQVRNGSLTVFICATVYVVLHTLGEAVYSPGFHPPHCWLQLFTCCDLLIHTAWSNR